MKGREKRKSGKGKLARGEGGRREIKKGQDEEYWKQV